MSNKKNLNEATVRRFWKLAGLRPINETPSYIQEEEVENNEANRMKLIRAIAEGLPDDQKPGFFKSENKRMKFDDAYFQKQYAAYKEDFEHLEEVASKEEEPMEEMSHMNRDDEVDEMAKMKRDNDLEEQLEEEDAMGEMDLDAEEAPGDELDLDDGDVDAEVSVPESDVEALRAARNVIDQILSAADGADAGDEMDPEASIEDEEVDLSDDEPEMAMEEENSNLDEDALDEMIESITAKVTKRLVKEALIKKLTK